MTTAVKSCLVALLCEACVTIVQGGLVYLPPASEPRMVHDTRVDHSEELFSLQEQSDQLVASSMHTVGVTDPLTLSTTQIEALFAHALNPTAMQFRGQGDLERTASSVADPYKGLSTVAHSVDFQIDAPGVYRLEVLGQFTVSGPEVFLGAGVALDFDGPGELGSYSLYQATWEDGAPLDVHVVQDFSLAPGSTYKLNLSGGIDMDDNFDGARSATFDYAVHFSLVPEPRAWATGTVGLGLTALVARRRQRG